jgi:hypothetical protein
MAPVASMISVSRVGIWGTVTMLVSMIGVHLVRSRLVVRMHRVRLEIVLRHGVRWPALPR